MDVPIKIIVFNYYRRLVSKEGVVRIHILFITTYENWVALSITCIHMCFLTSIHPMSFQARGNSIKNGRNACSQQNAIDHSDTPKFSDNYGI